jgi:hypothetical protein
MRGTRIPQLRRSACPARTTRSRLAASGRSTGRGSTSPQRTEKQRTFIVCLFARTHAHAWGRSGEVGRRAFHHRDGVQLGFAEALFEFDPAILVRAVELGEHLLDAARRVARRWVTGSPTGTARTHLLPTGSGAWKCALRAASCSGSHAGTSYGCVRTVRRWPDTQRQRTEGRGGGGADRARRRPAPRHGAVRSAGRPS